MSFIINLENVSSLKNLNPGEYTLWVKYDHEARTREALSVVVGYYHLGELLLQEEPEADEVSPVIEVAWRHATSGCLYSGPWAEYDSSDFEFEVGEIKAVSEFIQTLASGEIPDVMELY